jgi:hypothetical protein
MVNEEEMKVGGYKEKKKERGAYECHMLQGRVMRSRPASLRVTGTVDKACGPHSARRRTSVVVADSYSAVATYFEYSV